MKTRLLITLLLFSIVSSATIRTVNNNTNSPGQFTNLQTTINLSGIGDTILVTGSPNSYGSISLNKKMVIIGEGYKNDLTTINTLTLNRFDAVQSASGSYISGFYLVNGDINFNSTLDNITIDRCRIVLSSYIYFSGQNVSDINFRNSIVYGNGQYYSGFYLAGSFTNVKISNCILNCNIFGGGYNLNSVYFENNLFTRTGTGTVLTDVDNAIFNNNIFFKRDAGNSSSNCDGCVFNNNITYATSNNTIPYGTNLGSGNLINVDPLLVNFPSTGSDFDWWHDYHLQSNSPAKNAGTDNTDIGITGGSYPFQVSAPPRIPQVTLLDATPSSVPVGGTLQIHFKASKQD